MGAGVAKDIRYKWPLAYKTYLASPMVLGSVSFAHVSPIFNIWVANAITQQFYGRDHRRYVSYDALRCACKKVNQFALDNKISSINFPRIGCNLGGGDWQVVSAILEEEFDGDLELTCWSP